MISLRTSIAFAAVLAFALPGRGVSGDEKPEDRLAAHEAELARKPDRLAHVERENSDLRQALAGASAPREAALIHEIESLRAERNQGAEQYLALGRDLDDLRKECDDLRRTFFEAEEEFDLERVRLLAANRDVDARRAQAERLAAGATERAEKLAEAIRPSVATELAAPESERRIRAMRLAAAVGSKEMVPPLEAALDRPGIPLAERHEAVLALTGLGWGEPAAARLRKMAADAARTAEDRAAAFADLLECAAPADLPGLRPIADSLGNEARLALAAALASEDLAAPAVELYLALAAERDASGARAREELASILCEDAGADAGSLARAWERCRDETVSGTQANAQLLRVLAARTVTIDFKESPLADVAAYLADVTEIGFTCLGSAREALVTVAAKDILLLEATERVAAAAGAKCIFRAGAVVFATAADAEWATARLSKPFAVGKAAAGEPAWVTSARRRICEQRLTGHFPDTPLVDVAAFLADMTGLDIVLLPNAREAEIAVNLRLRDVTVENVLRIVCAETGLSGRLRFHAVIIGSDEDLDALGGDRPAAPAADATDADREVEMRLAERKISMSFDDTPLADAVGFLREVTGIELRYATGLEPEGRTVTLKVKDVPLAGGLELTLRPIGLGFAVSEGAIEIRPLGGAK